MTDPVPALTQIWKPRYRKGSKVVVLDGEDDKILIENIRKPLYRRWIGIARFIRDYELVKDAAKDLYR